MITEKLRRLQQQALQGVDPKKRQWLMLAGITVGLMVVLWVLFAVGDDRPQRPKVESRESTGVEGESKHVPIIATGQQVRPIDSWIAGAGKDVEQLKRDREVARRKLEEQEKTNKELKDRFEELQKRLNQASSNASRALSAMESNQTGPAAAPPAAPPPPPPLSGRAGVGEGRLPPPPPLAPGAAVAGMPGAATPPGAGLVRVSVSGPTAAAAVPAANGSKTGPADNGQSVVHNLDNFLPVSFTKAVLLGGLDAPTGGQSQSNPHPVLLRLEDNAVLPNRFRGQVRECFVIGAGYGDLSSERAYIRTERLSCLRADGTAIEIRIKGSIFGEDGKVGVRGRLVSKQGQVLANALIAGVVSGIGSGIQGRFTSSSTSALGNVSSVDPDHAFEAGAGKGIGKAMDRLAQYYISLAEKMFPIIEVDAGRLVDVVLTEGVVLDTPLSAAPSTESDDAPASYRPATAAARGYSTGARHAD